jgi:hypothetical protein
MDGFQFKVNKSMTKKDIDRVTKIFFALILISLLKNTPKEI